MKTGIFLGFHRFGQWQQPHMKMITSKIFPPIEAYPLKKQVENAISKGGIYDS